MNNLLQDIRYALRMLRKAPGFTAVATLTLALGIGANTAIFTVVNTVLLRSLPYKQSDKLVKVWGKYDRDGIPRNWISEPEWWDLLGSNRTFSELAAYASGDGANLVLSGSEPVRIARASTTASFFSILGVQPERGRFFNADEDQPGRNQVAVLSYALWKNSFGGDSSIVGRSVQLDGQNFTVVGVMQKGFSFGDSTDVWTPIGFDKAKPNGRGSHYLEVLGRLKPGITVAQSATDMKAFGDQLVRTYPDDYRPESGFGLYVVPLDTEVKGEIRPALLVLLGAVGVVLLIACANLANLLLVRASVRQREIGIRVALGARKVRILRQLLTESVVLAMAGGVLGLLLAYWGVEAFRGLSQMNIPRLEEIAIDKIVLGFAFGISVLTGFVFGLAPAIHAVGASLVNSLKDSGRGVSSGVAGNRLRAHLVVSEIALALVLLVGAGLLVRSFQHLLAVDPGFQTEHLLTMRLALPQARYPNGPAPAAFYKNLVERVKAIPGVQAAGTVTRLPLSGTYSSGTIFLEDTGARNAVISKKYGMPYLETDRRWITEGYFDAMKIPLRKGRKFTEADDRADAPPVVIVDEDFANRFWPDKDPIGKRLAYDTVENSNPPQPNWRTIVGVVGHVKHYGLDVEGREQAYFPAAQVGYARNMFLVVRTSIDPSSITSAVRAQLASLDPQLPIFGIETMDDLLTASLVQRQVNMLLLVSFSLLALVLAAIGIYGVMSYSVTLRTNEIGVRMALGAGRQDVMRMILNNGLRLAGIGLTAGLLLALSLTWLVNRLAPGLLFGVRATDPITYVVIALLLGAVAFGASVIPAFRATRVDPMIALRYE
ncbi:MAG TPA: ABC transporter permease [Alphaproteobacteria bacterium]|nr:ABC transporter permease [Alphaproteobacteria bacterium]